MLKRYYKLLERYDLLGHVCEQTQAKLIRTENELARVGAALIQANERLVKGKELVDQLMGVTEVNRRLAQENERLTAIVEGLEPPPRDDVSLLN